MSALFQCISALCIYLSSKKPKQCSIFHDGLGEKCSRSCFPFSVLKLSVSAPPYLIYQLCTQGHLSASSPFHRWLRWLPVFLYCGSGLHQVVVSLIRSLGHNPVMSFSKFLRSTVSGLWWSQASVHISCSPSSSTWKKGLSSLSLKSEVTMQCDLAN